MCELESASRDTGLNSEMQITRRLLSLKKIHRTNNLDAKYKENFGSIKVRKIINGTKINSIIMISWNTMTLNTMK